MLERIDTKRLLASGLVAGFVLLAGESVLNGLLLGPEWEQILYERDLQIGPVAGILIALLTLLLGILLTWLTVALRRRSGSGIRAVLLSSLVVWFTVFLYTCGWLGLIGVFPWRPLMFGIIWGWGETLLAALIGSWIYHRKRAS